MTTFRRRELLTGLSAATLTFLLPLEACGGEATTTTTGSGGESTTPPVADPLAVPETRPADWDPIAFNTQRGNAGAIPASYLPSVNGPDGRNGAVGKHLPYVPEVRGFTVPAGMVALMWGDPSKGHARHPNAVRSDANQMHGHWFDWIDVRKAAIGAAPAKRSSYPEWPGDADMGYRVLGGGDITAEDGKNTVYLAALPEDVRPGDVIRIQANCLTHGEYVDFLVVPA